MKLRSVLLAGFGLLSGVTYAQSAHQHGVAELFFAAGDEELAIEIHSPADNLLGFEHAPVTAAEQQALAAAKLQIENAPQLFSFNGGDCELESLSQEWGALQQSDHEHEHEAADHEHEHEHEAADHEHEHEHEAADHEHEHEHDAADHEHEHEHEAADHEHEHEHEAADHDHDHEHSGHQDVTFSYHFHCHQLSELQSFNLHWFERFPRMQKILVQGASDRGQIAIEVTAEQHKVAL
ncbi:ZrgA family zinc uptake protein [Agarivorans sp. QJM3NY_29]|uniref:ZrgA family zinc uptake protein n=1 Tax=unclassified Agarivorans TaxID=2636026 RepID=UPI003D7CD5C3